MAQNARTFIGAIKGSAESAKKQALIKQRELVDLRSVHAKLGEYAFDHGIGREQLPAQFQEIASFDAEIESKRNHTPLSATATIIDRARHGANIVKDRVVIEAILLRRKNVAIDLGRSLCAYEVDDQTITDLQKDAQRIEEEITALKAPVAGQ